MNTRLVVINANLPWAVTWAELKIVYEDGAKSLNERLVISRHNAHGDRYLSTLHCYVDSVMGPSGKIPIADMATGVGPVVGTVELYGYHKSLVMMGAVDFGVGVDSDWRFGDGMVKVWLLSSVN